MVLELIHQSDLGTDAVHESHRLACTCKRHQHTETSLCAEALLHSQHLTS